MAPLLQSYAKLLNFMRFTPEIDGNRISVRQLLFIISAAVLLWTGILWCLALLI